MVKNLGSLKNIGILVGMMALAHFINNPIFSVMAGVITALYLAFIIKRLSAEAVLISLTSVFTAYHFYLSKQLSLPMFSDQVLIFFGVYIGTYAFLRVLRFFGLVGF